MYKHSIKSLIVILMIIFVAGCATSGIKVESYFQAKPRVDQKLEGNAGYLAGTPKVEENAERKKTRKIFVVEVTQNEPSSKTKSYIVKKKAKTNKSVKAKEEIKTIESKVQATGVAASTMSNISAIDKIELGVVEGKAVPAEPQKPAFVEYKVEKDDTLQKISEKFYGSFGKWTKIYEVNKALIKNPDRIKPGITIRIPSQ
ncbi:MAG: LysM peptidoglycan-binding domain-containing protein [Candidatus Zapsychrus exili]|nr:LysM peptidoglycan-binding domain-containing protein [Candidatus Zapsychrus exili]